jgi:hypothetical protein
MKTIRSIYEYILTIPDHFFFFPEKVDGQNIYTKKGYDHMINRCRAEYGYEFYCSKLFIYRELAHLVGAIGLVILAHLVSEISETKIISLTMVLGWIVFMTIQEFYIHPKFYGQKLFKGITDWLIWTIPLLGYIFIYYL